MRWDEIMRKNGGHWPSGNGVDGTGSGATGFGRSLPKLVSGVLLLGAHMLLVEGAWGKV